MVMSQAELLIGHQPAQQQSAARRKKKKRPAELKEAPPSSQSSDRRPGQLIDIEPGAKSDPARRLGHFGSKFCSLPPSGVISSSLFPSPPPKVSINCNNDTTHTKPARPSPKRALDAARASRFSSTSMNDVILDHPRRAQVIHCSVGPEQAQGQPPTGCHRLLENTLVTDSCSSLQHGHGSTLDKLTADATCTSDGHRSASYGESRESDDNPSGDSSLRGLIVSNGCLPPAEILNDHIKQLTPTTSNIITTETHHRLPEPRESCCPPDDVASRPLKDHHRPSALVIDRKLQPHCKRSLLVLGAMLRKMIPDASCWQAMAPEAHLAVENDKNNCNKRAKSTKSRRVASPASAGFAGKLLQTLVTVSLFITLASSINTPPTAQTIEGCKFYPVGESRRFERVAENLPVGSEIFKLEAHPRSEFRIEPIDNSLSDVNYFKFVDLDDRFVAIKLNQSLEDLVDRRDPQNVLKFKLTCRGIGSQEDSFLPVTVYIHDVNDHAPEFQNVPYHLEVDELTPVGLTIFRSIHAIDRDKPNTANSDITYSIVGGNDNDSFILSDPIEGILVMNKALDYDHGKREFKIQIQASDHGNPSLSTVTTMTIRVKDADDQNPVFSHEIYTAGVSESAQITGKRIRDKVRVEPAIFAYDQDTGINARLRYSIILGNEDGYFEMNAQTGELFLIREIDLEKLTTPTLSLQIQASQVDNPFRQALARVDISVQDINDNSPDFDWDMYNITVIENLPPNFTVLQVSATDKDQGENAQFKYVLHDESGAFKIDPTTGWISVKDPTKLDRETTDHIRMQVTTVERKPNVNPDTSKTKKGTLVEINLLDSNDNTPFFVGTRPGTQRNPASDDGKFDAGQQTGSCLNVSSSASDQADCVVPINLYNFQVLETASPGTQIGHVYAYDRDLGDNGRVQYFKQNDSISLGAPFDVNPLNGSIYVLPQFTRLVRKQSAYTLFIKAIDSAQIHFERRHSVAVVQINVTDINNSVPEFIGQTPFEAYVGESLPEGAFVTQIYAKDDDSITEQLEYSIVAGNDEKLFIIDSKLGRIYTASVLDFERKQSYDLLVQVSDGVNTAVAPLIINIIDINDQQPVFAHQFYNFTIMEESGANQTVGQLLAMDRDSGKNAQLHYSLVGELANDAFTLEPKSGVLRTRRSLDCELEPMIDFQVLARDSGIPQLSGLTNVRVRVGDINDWAPKFELASYELEVQEELEPPVEVVQLKANDRDRDENAIIKYLIIGGNELGLFTINADTGQLSTLGRLNYESRREHRLQVAARNVHPFQGPQARSIVNPAVEILVRVGDINDELVTFERSSYQWKISELLAKNTLVGRFNATNLHRNSSEQDIVYWLGPVQVLHYHSSGANKPRQRNNDTTMGPADSASSKPASVSLSQKLWLDEKSGELVLVDGLDRDPPANEHQFRFSVFARDRRSINKLNASVPVIIDVLDANDNVPTFDEPSYQLEMPENLPAGTSIPTFFRVTDLDGGLNGRIIGYYLNGSRDELDIFQINNQTGTITLKSSLDYERQSVHKFDILALDGGQPQPLVGSARVQVQVANINEYSPKFINLPYEYQLQENSVPGTQVGQVKAVDQDGNKVTYSMSDGDTEFFAIEPTSGKIYVNRQLVPRTQYSFVVRATDDGQPQNYSLGVQVLIRVRDTNDFAPVFTQNSYSGTVLEKQPMKPAPGATTTTTNNNNNNNLFGPVLVKVEAHDKDLQNNSISYSIVSGNEDSIFSIDRRTGEIRVASAQASRMIDFDKRRQYTLLVQAQDSHEIPLVGLTMVQIDVIDTNDHAPSFNKPAYLAQVAENAPPGTCFLKIEADPRDSLDAIQYSLASSSSLKQHQQQAPGSSSPRSADPINQLFEIHPSKGILCTKLALDREQRASYELVVLAHDGKFESQAPISVEILDENDNKPLFDSDQYATSLAYDSQPGRTVAQVHASDPDSGSNGLVQYWIKNTHGLFQIDAKTGQVRLVTKLPSPSIMQQAAANGSQASHQQHQTFELKVFAQDQGVSPQIGETTLLIRLTNSENHPPKFDKFVYQVEVDENVSGVPLIQVQAHDPDAGKAGKLIYRLARIQSASLMKANQNININNNNNNNNANQQQPPQSGQPANKKLQAGQASASDQLVAEQQINLDYLRSAFKIDKSSGKITLMEPLDYEEIHHVELIIEARDESLTDAQSTTAFVQVQVNDLNDNRPEFLAMPRRLRVSSSTQPNSEIIYTIQATDSDSSAHGNNQLEYRLETASKYFNVHPQTGVLYAISALPTSLAEGGQTMPELEAEKLPGGATIYSETLTVIAQDRSPSQPLMDRISFDVEVYRDQADDAHPIFNSNQYFVQSENSIEPGTVVLAPKATIPNGDSIVYNISSIESYSRSSASSGSGSAASQAQQLRSLVKRFAIDSDSGRISTTSKLEANDELAPNKNIYHFIIKATNRLQPELSSEAGVVVRLWDTGHRCPRFPFTEYYASVAENAPIDSIAVPNLVIDDVERFAGQKLSYQITEDNSNDNFFIDVSSSGQQQQQQQQPGAAKSKIQVSLRVKKALDRETMPKFLAGMYTLTVSATNNRCATQARVKIMIEDQNDNSPTFDKSDYYVELRENSPIGHVVSQLQASDLDELDYQRLRYFIAPPLDEEPLMGAGDPLNGGGQADPAKAQAMSSTDLFEMEQRTGTLSVRREIDREKAAKHLLRIMAIDQANNTGWTNLHVRVLDENDWSPSFLNETFFMNATEGPSSLGTRIRLPVFDYDDGMNRQMEVYIVEGNSNNEFRLDVDEAGPLLTIVQELDWERYARLEWSPLARSVALQRQLEWGGPVALHTIQIAAKDKGQPARVGKTSVIVYLHDINDNAPKFTHESYYEFVDENAPIGSVIATVKATDMDSAQMTNLTYAFSRRHLHSSPVVAAASSPAAPLAPASSSQRPSNGSAPNQQAAAGAVSPVAQPAGLLARPRLMRPIHRISKRQVSSGQAGPAKPAHTLPFALDPLTGVVSVARQLDISEQQQYQLTIEAFDGLWRTETQMRIFINEVEDPRDISARSSEATNHYRFQVRENQPDALVGQVDLKPKKLRINSQIRYSIVNGEMRQLFKISQLGEIFTQRGLDREQQAQYTFTVMLEERNRASNKLTVAEVIVDVMDENDEIPTFMHVYHGTIKENSPPGTQVFLLPTTHIKAIDNDTRNNSQINYSLSGTGSDRFQIQANGYVVFQPRDESQVLDRELRADYKLDVHASDNGNLSSKTTLSIKIEDENDNAPVFETGPLFVLIPETAKAGSKIVQVKARDRDELGPNSEIHYKISSANSLAANQQQHHQQRQQPPQPALNDVIRIDQQSGELFVVGQLQPASSYQINVTATDSGGLSAQTQVNVTVIDVNDHRPQFERSSYNFVVFEGNYTRNPLKLATLRATDEDLGKNGQIEYLLLTDPQHEASIPIANPATQLASLLQQNNNANQQQQQSQASGQGFPISIDVNTGELFARGHIDREQRDTFVFKVLAMDLGEPVSLNTSCEVTIKVKDINDEPPRFYTDPYLALVPENLEPGHKVTQIAAFDPDSGENGQVFYKLGEGHEGKFYIDGKDGTVWTLASLDYEQKNFYNITIIAYDRGLPSLHSSAKLWITVADMNDAVPNFPKAVYSLEVAENAKLGDTIFTLNAGKGAFKYSWFQPAAMGPTMEMGSHHSQHSSGQFADYHQQARSELASQQHQHLFGAYGAGGLGGAGGGGGGSSSIGGQSALLRHSNGHLMSSDALDEAMETFSIEPSTGHIKLAKPLDSVSKNHYRLVVKAQDESEPPKFDTAEINILVGTGQGVRLFSQRVYEVRVLENQLAPLLLIDLNCTDEMIHQPVQYSIVGSDHRGLFRVEPDSGRLSVTSSLDRERRESYVIKIKAETGNLNQRQKRDTAAPAGNQPPGQQHQHQARWSAPPSGQQQLGSADGGAGGRRLVGDLNELEQRFYGHSARLLAASAAPSGSGQPSGGNNASLLQNLHLAYDETFVLITVDDENDNGPVFNHKNRPIVSAVPLEASFGYEIARVQARDLDSGLNGQIHYELQSRLDDSTSKFSIDSSTGAIRSMVNFALDNGRVYNFDVRATDRAGQENGNSALMQVFVYVLPETKMVLMVTDTEPIKMEKRSVEVINYLSNITGFEVKLAKLEPHIEGNSPEPFSTDMFLYAVNPSLNNIVDTETLLNVFRQSSQTILSHLHTFKIRRIQGVQVQEKISQMGATEIAIIALSSIVFVGSIVAILLLCSCKSILSGQPVGPGRARRNSSSVARIHSSNTSQQSIWDNHHSGHHGGSNNNMNGHSQHQQRAFNLKAGLLLNGSEPKLAAGSPQQQLINQAANGHHYLMASSNQSTTLGADGQPNTHTTLAADSSEYVDSLISYKRANSSLAGSRRAKLQQQVPAMDEQQAQLSSAARARPRDDWTSGLDPEFAEAMNEHHLGHHLHHHHHLHHRHAHHNHHLEPLAPGSAEGSLGGQASDEHQLRQVGLASALGGLIRGPRARLSTSAAGQHRQQARPGDDNLQAEPDDDEEELDPNTETHSDNELFDDEDDDDDDDHQAQDRPPKPSPMEQAKHQASGGQNFISKPLRNKPKLHQSAASIRSADRSMYSGDSNWDSTDDSNQQRALGITSAPPPPPQQQQSTNWRRN